MIHLIQLYKLVDDKKLFISIFDDISYELEELGFKDFPCELIDDMLFIHFGISLEDENQLERLTNCILKFQGKIGTILKGINV